MPITQINLSDKFSPSYGIGNIDDDAAAEIIILSGRKCKLTVLDNNGATVVGKLFPKSTKNKFHSLLIGNFSSFIE